MQMMIVLKPIAFDVIIYMTQLFDYYLYAVSVHLPHHARLQQFHAVRTLCVLLPYFLFLPTLCTQQSAYHLMCILL